MKSERVKVLKYPLDVSTHCSTKPKIVLVLYSDACLRAGRKFLSRFLSGIRIPGRTDFSFEGRIFEQSKPTELTRRGEERPVTRLVRLYTRWKDYLYFLQHILPSTKTRCLKWRSTRSRRFIKTTTMSWVSATGMKWDDLLALGSRTVVQQAPTVYTPTDYQMRYSSCGSSYECVSRVSATFHVHANRASLYTRGMPRTSFLFFFFFSTTRTPATRESFGDPPSLGEE